MKHLICYVKCLTLVFCPKPQFLFFSFYFLIANQRKERVATQGVKSITSCAARSRLLVEMCSKRWGWEDRNDDLTACRPGSRQQLCTRTLNPFIFVFSLPLNSALSWFSWISPRDLLPSFLTANFEALLWLGALSKSSLYILYCESREPTTKLCSASMAFRTTTVYVCMCVAVKATVKKWSLSVACMYASRGINFSVFYTLSRLSQVRQLLPNGIAVDKARFKKIYITI